MKKYLKNSGKSIVPEESTSKAANISRVLLIIIDIFSNKIGLPKAVASKRKVKRRCLYNIRTVPQKNNKICKKILSLEKS